MTKTLFILAAIAGLVAAQAPPPQPSFKGVIRLNQAPVSNEVLRVKLPRPVERQLSNGIKLLVVESHRVPTVSLRISIPSGSLRDPAGVPGVSDAAAALIRLGTKTRSARDIAETLAELGATITVASAQGFATISLSSLTENLDSALAVFTDVLLNPTFPQDELDKWKTRQRSSLEQGKTSPGFLANDQLMKVLYGADARQYVHPTVESLNKITRESVIEHYKTYYVPSEDWAGMAGDITPRDAVSKLEKALGGWKGGPVRRIALPMPPQVAEKKVYLISRPNSVQTFLLVANHAIDRNNPDYIAVMVMNQVLGSGPSSRLFRNIREDKGYTYGISSGFNATRNFDHFTASTSVRTEVTEPALAELLKEFRDIRETPVPAGELADARRAIVAGFVLGLQSSSAVLGQWLDQRDYGFPEDYWDTYPEKVMAVTVEDVQRVAKKYIPLDNAQIIAVGDLSKIGDLLKNFGPVEQISPH